jgi:hypothetical protein
MTCERLIMDINVFDKEKLFAAARKHAPDTEIVSIGDALIVLLDPGGGGDAYAGNLNDAGIQIEQTTWA